MPDRLFVYKTPAQRLLEAASIFGGSLLIADYAQGHLPYLSTSLLVLGLLIILALVVPMIGSTVARQFGAPLMTDQQRTRRYLDEIRPIFQSYAQPRHRPDAPRTTAPRQRSGRRG